MAAKGLVILHHGKIENLHITLCVSEVGIYFMTGDLNKLTYKVST